jgi:hypothetical protein
MKPRIKRSTVLLPQVTGPGRSGRFLQMRRALRNDDGQGAQPDDCVTPDVPHHDYADPAVHKGRGGPVPQGDQPDSEEHRRGYKSQHRKGVQ